MTGAPVSASPSRSSCPSPSLTPLAGRVPRRARPLLTTTPRDDRYRNRERSAAASQTRRRAIASTFPFRAAPYGMASGVTEYVELVFLLDHMEPDPADWVSTQPHTVPEPDACRLTLARSFCHSDADG